MNSSFDHISGQIIIRGRAYSAKEIIRGLLEQGIAITENPDGLKIGFKSFSPEQTLTQNENSGNILNNCPFMPFMSQITTRIDELTRRIENQTTSTTSSMDSIFRSPPIDTTKESPLSKFSPFSDSAFRSSNDQEKEKFFNQGKSFLSRQKCPSCGTSIPQNAIFCNKCGSHIRSG
ncbi:zinc ribbon domain-containing protein [Candidatus Hodarchaeum mangrovi]